MRIGRRTVGVAALTVLAAASVLVGWGATHHQATRAAGASGPQDECSRQATIVTTALARTEVEGAVFEVPPGWYYVPVCFITAAIVQPMGYFTTQAQVAQCGVAKGGGCGAPVDRLGRNAGLVELSTQPPGLEPAALNTSIAGHPARVTIRHHPRPPAGHCEVTVEARIQTDEREEVSAYACLTGTQTAHLDTIMRMLRSATY